jgi:hypothetical protein
LIALFEALGADVGFTPLERVAERIIAEDGSTYRFVVRRNVAKLSIGDPSFTQAPALLCTPSCLTRGLRPTTLTGRRRRSAEIGNGSVVSSLSGSRT